MPPLLVYANITNIATRRKTLKRITHPHPPLLRRLSRAHRDNKTVSPALPEITKKHPYGCFFVDYFYHLFYRLFLPLIENFFSKTHLAAKSDFYGLVYYEVAVKLTENLMLVGRQNDGVYLVGAVENRFECEVYLAVV